MKGGRSITRESALPLVVVSRTKNPAKEEDLQQLLRMGFDKAEKDLSVELRISKYVVVYHMNPDSNSTRPIFAGRLLGRNVESLPESQIFKNGLFKVFNINRYGKELT